MSSQKNCCMLRLYRRQKSAGVRAAKGLCMYSRPVPPDNLHRAIEAESAKMIVIIRAVTLLACSRRNGRSCQSTLNSRVRIVTPMAQPTDPSTRRKRFSCPGTWRSSGRHRRTNTKGFTRKATNCFHVGGDIRRWSNQASNTLIAVRVADIAARKRGGAVQLGSAKARGLSADNHLAARLPSRRSPPVGVRSARSKLSPGHRGLEIQRADAAFCVGALPTGGRRELTDNVFKMLGRHHRRLGLCARRAIVDGVLVQIRPIETRCC